MDHPTSTIIPTALKKYGIDMPWHNYSLYLEYGGTERRLELDEMPLALFKNLKRKGHKPIFRLERCQAPSGREPPRARARGVSNTRQILDG
jgi:hypothetical protein